MAKRHSPTPDGPRSLPAPPGTLFAAPPAASGAAGVAAVERLREIVLAGWLRRQMKVACPACRFPIEWAGRWEDMPQCPGCHRVPELEEPIRLDGEFLVAARTPAVEGCRYCGKDMSFVLNVDTGKEGPIAVRDVVYVVMLPARPVADAGVDAGVRFEATTAKAFCESGGKVVWPDGREVPLADLLFHVSHFATCPSAAAASKAGGYRR